MRHLIKKWYFALLKSTGIYAIPLAATTMSPVAPRFKETVGERLLEGAHGAAGSIGSKTIHIDLDGIMERAVAIPVDGSDISQLDMRKDRIYYLTLPVPLFSGFLKGESSALHCFDLEDGKDDILVRNIDSYSLSLDGDTVAIKQGANYSLRRARSK